MVVSLPERRTLVIAFVALLIPLADAAAPRAGVGLAAARGNEISLDAGNLEVVSATNQLRFTDITIAQGPLKIQAPQAEARGPELDFDNSRWEFRGGVRIDFEGGNLIADSAVVTFRAKRIARAEASGSPAQFEQKLDKYPEPAKGRAGVIDYDVATGRVTMNRGTWFTYNRNEFRSEQIEYNVREQRLVSGGATPAAPGATPNGGGNGRIHITIRPDEDERAPAAPSPP